MEPKSLKHFEIMEKSIDYASNLIDELLNFGKKTQIKQEKINVKDLLNYILKTIHVPDNIKADVRLVNENINIYGDRGKISRAILNIIQNAIQAMPEGGNIEIYAEKDGECGIIRIKDTGSGIEPDYIKRIFEPFFTTKTKGTGLGLAITKRYIELNNGDISVESVAGEGSVFTISLCLKKNEE
jgi:signal transduction histidine kinase